VLKGADVSERSNVFREGAENSTRGAAGRVHSPSVSQSVFPFGKQMSFAFARPIVPEQTASFLRFIRRLANAHDPFHCLLDALKSGIYGHWRQAERVLSVPAKPQSENINALS
jgi:hypothetical protein